MTEKIFVGHWYSRDFMDDYRDCLREVFQKVNADIELIYADSEEQMGNIWNIITELIDNSLLCIFDISEESRPNIFLELGYALGKNKYIILTSRQLPEKASDIAGFKIIIYHSLTHLKEILTGQMSKSITKALTHNEKFRASAVDEDTVSNSIAIRLLKLHKDALRDAIFNYVDEYLLKLKRPGFSYDSNEVMRTVRSHIGHSRNRLRGLKNRKVGDLKNFVERNFSDIQLINIFRNDISPIFLNPKLGTKAKKERLHDKINLHINKAFEGFYHQLSNNSDSDSEKSEET